MTEDRIAKVLYNQRTFEVDVPEPDFLDGDYHLQYEITCVDFEDLSVMEKTVMAQTALSMIDPDIWSGYRLMNIGWGERYVIVDAQTDNPPSRS